MLDGILVFDPVLFGSLSGALVAFGLLFYFTQDRGDRRSRSDIRKRLDVATPMQATAAADEKSRKQVKSKRVVVSLAKKTADFYANSDPKNLRKTQLSLMQAGYMHPSSVGYFMAARIVLGVLMAAVGVAVMLIEFSDWTSTNKAIGILLFGSAGYFMPNMHVNKRRKKMQAENRAGFPDVMDLMIVGAEAGLTMEGSIERISKEVAKTYPSLSTQLNIAALEIRAGRPIDQALRAFGERLGLDEVQGFATMIQQSKELGTSIADALRVYSEEMRHKRMMMAEEKAYALPAKLSIPVTAFILPIVIGVAVLPTAVRLMNQ